MKKIIDLSRTIFDGMPTLPFDEAVRLYEDKTLEKDGYNNSRLETGLHAGTHMDAPRHFIDTDIYIGDFELERFMAKGCLLDVSGEDVITYKQAYRDQVQEGDIILLYTGFGAFYDSDVYYKKRFNDHPVVHMDLAKFFIEKKIKMLGMDLPKPDNHPYDIHKILLQNNILILENMANLEKLIGIPNFEVMAFPLKIKAEASLVRAVACIG